MQRLEALIEKLNIQYKNRVPLPQLLATVEMIQLEINGALKETKVLGAGNVAVFIPSVPVHSAAKPNGVPATTLAQEKEYYPLIVDENDVDEQELEALKLTGENNLFAIENFIDSKNDMVDLNDLDVLSEVPTLSQQIRDEDIPLPGQIRNDSHSEAEKKRSFTRLCEGISEQDRNNFIIELFRNDELMYERSIRTIDKFNTLEEAEYWINRELRTKLGWVNNKAMRRFDEIIQLRFP